MKKRFHTRHTVFALAILLGAASYGGLYFNEWTFEYDPPGRMLSEAVNSGMSLPLARFEDGFGDSVFTADRFLMCIGQGEVPSVPGYWSDGARLDANLSEASSGVHYLRYDVEYDMRTYSRSGALFGVYFAGSNGSRVAGVLMGDARESELLGDYPALQVDLIDEALPAAGILTAIAEVDLDAQTLRIWYQIGQTLSIDYASPAFQGDLDGFTLDKLRFYATGDIRVAGSDDYLAVDNIRHTVGLEPGGMAWNGIIAPLLDITRPPELDIILSDSLNGVMEVGQTNRLTLLISNRGGQPASDVTSTLDIPPQFTLVASNAVPQTLDPLRSLENSYDLVANETGLFDFTGRAVAVETNSVPKDVRVSVGRQVRYQSHLITPVPPGSSAVPGKTGPGETIDIAVTSANIGGITVQDITNSLTAASGFLITPQDGQIYPVLNAGETASTTYRVHVSPQVEAGVYSFEVVNAAGGEEWRDSFDLEIFVRPAQADYVKADNENALSDPQSWMEGVVPGLGDRAVFDGTVQSAIATEMGNDLFWRGILLAGNTAEWTIQGSNTLSIGSAGINMTAAGADLRIEAPLNLVSTQNWTVATGRTLAVPAAVHAGVDQPLVKRGGGILTLSNPLNQFESGIVLREGTLGVAGENVLGSGNVWMEGGAVLSTSGTAVLTNRVVVAGPVQVDNASGLVLNGLISGAGRIRKTGGGVLTLGGANTYSGGTVNEGVIEITHKDALGSGALTMESGSALQVPRRVLLLNSPGIANPIVLNGNAVLRTATTTSADLLRVDGPISGSGQLTLSGQQILLYGNNSFSGGLLLNHSSWLRGAGPQSLGTGIIRVAGGTRLLLLNQGGTISSDIELETILRLNLYNQTIVLAGNISGPGSLNLLDGNGTLMLSGDNSDWTGDVLNLRGNKTLQINSPSAIGNGSLISFGGAAGAVVVQFNAHVAGGIPHAMTFAEAYNVRTGEDFPVEFEVNRDTVFHGDLSDAALPNTAGIIKTGPARLSLHGDAAHSAPTQVLEGVLEVNGRLSSELVIGSGAVLEGTGIVHDVLFEAGSILRLNHDAMRFERAPRIRSGAIIELRIADRDAHAAIVTTGSDTLELAGTLILDFSDSNVMEGDTLSVLRGWPRLVDRGLTIQRANLRPGLELNTERLFVDGTVSIEARDVIEPPVLPGDRVKENNELALDDPASWVGGTAPGPANRVVLNNRVSSPLRTPLGADLSWRGIALISNTVDWTISGPETVSLGSSGVDLSEAAADLDIRSAMILPVNQRWNIGTGRKVRVTGQLGVPEPVEWVKTGEGTLAFSGGISREVVGPMIVSNGILAVSGGYNRQDNLRVELGAPPIGSGRLYFSGGTKLETAGANGGIGNSIRIGEGQLWVAPGQSLLLAGPIEGNGGLVHTGAGVVRLAGNNSFTGGTLVDRGCTLEFTHFRAFGAGRITLRDGATLLGWLPSEEILPQERTVNNEIFLDGKAIIENIADVNFQSITFSGPISGPGGVQFNLSTGRRDIFLTNRNTFEGDLEISTGTLSVALNAAGPGSLGRGAIVCLSANTGFGLNQTGGMINNRINLTSGSMNYINLLNGLTVDLAGEIFGSGYISFVNRPGTIRLSGDNRFWSGGISGIGSHSTRNGIKRVIVDHPYALGTGTVVLGGHTVSRNFIEIYVRAPVKTRNDLYAANSGPEKERNDLLVISHDSVFGRLGGDTAHQGLDKTGPGRMTLTAHGNYPSPFNVRAGSLKLETGAGFPGKTTVFPDAALVASNARTGPVRVRSGGTIEVKGAGLRVEGGALTLEGDVQMILRPSLAQAGPGYVPLLTGDGTGGLSLSGTLLVDFSAIDPPSAAGDFVALFGGWNRMLNNGVTVLASGLDDFMTLDTSTLFSDGRVRVVDGGRLGSQDLLIRVTSGGTGSTSVQVRNPGSETRYFRPKPGAEWPSWLSAAPASARTAVGPGAQTTVTVTANATGLPAGTHRFMLPVVWEHGVSDLILVTVQVEGPSLGVAPGSLTLPVFENTTGEGTVDLVNNGTLPVSYRIRRMLAEHEAYTQPAADVPWITVSPTALTEITSFTNGRSTLRAIGFGFPFFGTTETEVSVGIDGTLWFGGKPAIRVFSNQLDYQPGRSKITANPEADRFIVTWNRMVQPDSAQQTFQAVLHRDGRIDLRYHTIVADSAWRSALIGLHGPTQWFPAQVPETLQGRTIRFARDEQIARISIAQTSGTVASGATQTLTVSGNATGLTNGDSRTAIFAIDYDGGLAGTAGEVQVTMNVTAPAPDPVGDGLMDDLAPPIYPRGPDPVVVLDPPQRTGGGRKITWSVDGEMQPFDAPVYRIEATTNLLSGIWTDRASVTNQMMYIDAEPMDGPVIFYRVIKE